MGYFSWLTSDSLESIMCEDSGCPTRPVFLLQPNGQEPIRQEAYQGFGMFGETDAYVWLAERNLTPEQRNGLGEDMLRDIGITLDCGHYFVDAQTGDKWSVFHDGAQIVDPTILHFPGNYEQVMPTFGETPNALIASGKLVRKGFAEYVALPLKFSFEASAVYEGLEPSSHCPMQGYFSDVEDDEDECIDEEISAVEDETVH